MPGKSALLLLILSLSFSFAFCQTSGKLIGHWPMDGDAKDISGNDHHGNVHGATLSNDRFSEANQSYSFDGANDYIDLGNLGDMSSFTFSAWISARAASSKNNYKTIVSNANQCQYDVHNAIFSYSSGGSVSANTGNGSTFNGAQNHDKSAEMGEWIFVICSYNGSTHTLVLGTNEVTSEHTFQNSAYQDGISTFLGARPCSSGGRTNFFFNGRMDDVKIWDYAKTKEDVEKLWKKELKKMGR